MRGDIGVSESSFPLIRKFFSDMNREGRSKHMLALVALALAAALLLLGLGSCEGGGKSDEVYMSEEGLMLDAWRRMEEEKLSALLCQLEGVERCFVSISYLSGEESTRGASTTVSFVPPRVGAVVVLYDGAGSIQLKQTLLDMVSTLYGIGTHRVSINLM